MTKLPRYDPFRHWFAWPRWMDEWEESSAQRRFKIKETDKNIVAEAVVAGVLADVKVHIEDGFLTIKGEYQFFVLSKLPYNRSIRGRVG